MPKVTKQPTEVAIQSIKEVTLQPTKEVTLQSIKEVTLQSIKEVVIQPTEVVFSATNYRISTITVTGSINSDIVLDKLYLMLVQYTPKEIDYLEHGSNKHEFVSHGVKASAKTKKKVKEPKIRKRFDNQLTIVLWHDGSRYNIKLFKNGNVQITGVKSIEKGEKTIDFLIEIIKNVYEEYDKTILENVESLKNLNYRIRLINSDFRVNFEIRLDYLFTIVTKTYRINCSYEPCIYPGAKIEYYYPHNGYCQCTTFCNGKSDACKKITIAVFQSGCVIITGANKIEHVNIAYEFVCNLLKDNLEKIQRKKLVLPPKKV